MTVPCLSFAIAILSTDPLEWLEWLVRLPLTIFHGYSSLVRWAADSVHSLFNDYGYWVIFLGTLFENTLLLGLIVPGVLVVVLAGLNAHDGALSLPIVYALGVLGTVLGDTISYCLGRFGWARFGSGQTLREAAEKVREPILRRGMSFILVYHFAGYTRLVGPAAAGFLKLPYRTWAPADYAGAALWVGVYLAVGYALGALGLTLDSTNQYFRYLEWGLLVLVAVMAYYMIRASRSWFLPEPTDEEETTPATGA